MPEGHLVSAPPLCQPCSAPQGQAESGGMVLVAYAGPVRPAAALRASVLCLPTDIHSLFVNKPSSSSSLSPMIATRRPAGGAYRGFPWTASRAGCARACGNAAGTACS